ncbi:MAG: DNA ligase D [Bacteroidia bacterium]
MSLTAYNKKRNFKKTNEPEGKHNKLTEQSIFVVQKHDASHLHYDFRLELNGVLKSWAIPKGPSMDPGEKRLAMMVEDHPYSYRNFEGTIPEGNYGAGNVIVWDNGTFHEIGNTDKESSEKATVAGIKKGHLSFFLEGKKLKGEFALIKVRGRQENAWLLIKKDDKYASTEDILLKDKSVISRKKLVPRKRAAVKTVVKKKRKKLSDDLLQIRPMLASLAEKPFDDENWIFEVKYDGYRAIAAIDQSVHLYSRNNISFNELFAALVPELKKIEHTAILDGEVVVENSMGRSDFQLLQNYRLNGKGILKYYVFDLLNLDGIDLRDQPLQKRKELLKLLLEGIKSSHVVYSDHIEKDGTSFFKSAVKNNLEGIIAKEKDSIYHSGKRSKQWLKIKISHQEEAIIAGFTAPGGSRKHFGSLILGAYNGKELKYLGNCGTGFNDASLKELYQKLKPLFISKSPFKERIRRREQIQWVKPKIVCQVKFTEWTSDGHMRHPVFAGLRIDKSAKEVRDKMEKEESPNTEVKGNRDLTVGTVTLHLTNQDKIYFPKDKITKGDIIEYYNEISSLILPYVEGRPQSMNRFPNGIAEPGFYQKDVDLEKSPDWLKTERIYSTSNKAYIDYLLCNDKATLLYMANLGCIEINPWNSQVGSLDNPDWVVIDLDPEKIAFSKVVETAWVVKGIMDELETECYCKTSGATGLHIYVPLAAKYNYELVKTFAELIAQTVFSRLPGITSIVRSPLKRQRKVYVDFLQNRKGQTLAAPYSVRPKPGATVSTPLEWKEVNEKLDPQNFTMKNTLKRIEQKGDLWAPVIGKGANLDKIIKKIYNSKL